MKQLEMRNGDVIDAPDRCPECGRPLAHVEDRGDATAYVHQVDRPKECLV